MIVLVLSEKALHTIVTHCSTEVKERRDRKGNLRHGKNQGQVVKPNVVDEAL